MQGVPQAHINLIHSCAEKFKQPNFKFLRDVIVPQELYTAKKSYNKVVWLRAKVKF